MDCMIPSMNSSHPIIATVVVWAGLSVAWHNVRAQAQTRGTGPQVPFIGCESDGQVGPLKAPKEKGERLAVRAEIANRVAYYQAENGFGVLAPRGWYCFSTYGSSGSSLFVSPEPITDKKLFTSDWKGFSGPAIQVSVSYGDTSGRFTVAKTIARVFPERMAFVRRVISEGIEPASLFPTTPYASDTLQRRGKNIVEFETPANTKGLGSQSQLAINPSPIQGVVILSGEGPNLVQLSMRLPDRYQSLGRTIIQHLETEVTAFGQMNTGAPTFKQFVDPENGVSFRYPATWLLNQGGISYMPPLITDNDQDPIKPYEPTVRVALEGRDAPQGPYSGTNFMDGVFLYRVAPELNAEQCYAKAKFSATNSRDDDWKADSQIIAGVRFQHLSGGQAGLCNESNEDLYATFHGGKCFLFEKDINTICPGAAPRDITPKELADIGRALDKVMQSVRFTKSSAR